MIFDLDFYHKLSILGRSRAAAVLAAVRRQEWPVEMGATPYNWPVSWGEVARAIERCLDALDEEFELDYFASRELE